MTRWIFCCVWHTRLSTVIVIICMQEEEKGPVVTTVTTRVDVTHSGSIKQEEKKGEAEKTEKDALIEGDAHLQSGKEEGGEGKEKREGMPRKVCEGQES